jgi:hypothetical protein
MFERLGKLLFAQMSPPFFFSLLVLPPLLSALALFFQIGELKELEARFAAAARKEKIAIARKERKENFLQKYAQVNPYFLDQQIESLPLLENERQKLEQLLHHPAFPNHPSFRERLHFISQNRLQFAEENLQTSATIKEVEEKLRHPVQIDESDLKKILALIENRKIESFEPSPSSPQLIVQDLQLTKIKTALQTEVFELDLQLLKREFIK